MHCRYADYADDKNLLLILRLKRTFLEIGTDS